MLNSVAIGIYVYWFKLPINCQKALGWPATYKTMRKRQSHRMAFCQITVVSTAVPGVLYRRAGRYGCLTTSTIHEMWRLLNHFSKWKIIPHWMCIYVPPFPVKKRLAVFPQILVLQCFSLWVLPTGTMRYTADPFQGMVLVLCCLWTDYERYTSYNCIGPGFLIFGQDLKFDSEQVQQSTTYDIGHMSHLLSCQNVREVTVPPCAGRNLSV